MASANPNQRVEARPSGFELRTSRDLAKRPQKRELTHRKAWAARHAERAAVSHGPAVGVTAFPVGISAVNASRYLAELTP